MLIFKSLQEFLKHTEDLLVGIIRKPAKDLSRPQILVAKPVVFWKSSSATLTITTHPTSRNNTLFDCAHCGGGVRTVALALWIGCPQIRDLKRPTT